MFDRAVFDDPTEGPAMPPMMAPEGIHRHRSHWRSRWVTNGAFLKGVNWPITLRSVCLVLSHPLFGLTHTHTTAYLRAAGFPLLPWAMAGWTDRDLAARGAARFLRWGWKDLQSIPKWPWNVGDMIRLRGHPTFLRIADFLWKVVFPSSAGPCWSGW